MKHPTILPLEFHEVLQCFSSEYLVVGHNGIVHLIYFFVLFKRDRELLTVL